MNSQRGNLCRTSAQTRSINNIDMRGVCKRCKNKLERKIEHKKYNPLKAPKKCRKCEHETVMEAYHTVCIPCAKLLNICSKCRKNHKMVQKLERAKSELMKKCSKLFRESKDFSLNKKCVLFHFIAERTVLAGPDLTLGSETMKELQDEVFEKLEYLKAKNEDQILEILNSIGDNSNDE